VAAPAGCWVPADCDAAGGGGGTVGDARGAVDLAGAATVRVMMDGAFADMRGDIADGAGAGDLAGALGTGLRLTEAAEAAAGDAEAVRVAGAST
jgi:hypothetical protein